MALAFDSKDVLTEILLRLPAKSLIRFKSVCKEWLSLISSDYFSHQHTLRLPKLQQSLILRTCNSQLFYFNQTKNGEMVMIPYTLNSILHHYLQILQDCNGLLLLEFDRLKNCDYVYNPTTEELERHLKNIYYVYNPTTRQARKIALTESDKFPYVEAVSLAFDPSNSPYYKVVCVRSTTHPLWAHSRRVKAHAYQFEVYDSESHTWKISFEPSTCPIICKRYFNSGAQYWNNSILWRADDVDCDYCYFDIAKNEIKTLYYPSQCESSRYIHESSGHLYCLELLKEHPKVSVGVWELGGDDHSQWISKHRGEFHPRSWHGFYVVKVVGEWGGDGATCSLLIYDESPTRMMAFNFLDNSYESLLELEGRPRHSYMEGFRFGETLALV